MHCTSQNTYHMNNIKSSTVPRYTILPRPTNKGCIKTDTGALTPEVPSALTADVTIVKTESTSSLFHSVPNVVPNRPKDVTSHVTSSSLSSDRIIQGDWGQQDVQTGGNHPIADVTEHRTLEKTPLSRVNDLARFHKIPVQFVLVAEEGPPHNKTFYVQLTLGDEVYHDSASSMKRAQHSVANMALERTRYAHPPDKHRKLHLTGYRTGQQEQTANSQSTCSIFASAGSETFECSGKVSDVEHERECSQSPFASSVTEIIVGEDGSRCTIMPCTHETKYSSCGLTEVTSSGSDSDLPTDPASRLEPNAYCRVDQVIAESCRQPAVKSVINEVQELAVRLGLLVKYDIQQETPAPHVMFVIQCSCGCLSTLGTGSNKKTAKKNAAELMLADLQKLSISSDIPSTSTKKIFTKRKKTKCTITKLPDDCAMNTNGAEFNYAGRLMQFQQARKGSTPVYKEIGMNGSDFVVEVYVDSLMCAGVGRTKKLAKRDAADKMLKALGFGVAAAPTKSALKRPNTTPSSEKKVTFCEPDLNPVAKSPPTAVLVPKPQTVLQKGPVSFPVQVSDVPLPPDQGQPNRIRVLKRPPQAPSNSHLELTSVPSSVNSHQESELCHRPETSLHTALYRLQQTVTLLGVTFQFTDLPKEISGKGECLSVVTISTKPPLITHGVGPSLEVARENASILALETLAELGI